MPSRVNNPSGGSTFVGVFSPMEGGTGVTTQTLAEGALDGVSKTKRGVPNGPIPLNSQRKIPNNLYSFLDQNSVALVGNTTVAAGKKAVFEITNYGSNIDYVTTGPVEVTPYGELIYTAPAEIGPQTFTINGRVITMTVTNGMVAKPYLISPADGDYVTPGQPVVFQGSAFISTDLSDAVNPFISSDWEISQSKDVDQNNEYSKIGVVGTSITVDTLFEDVWYYARVRYHGTNGSSVWSDWCKFRIGYAATIEKPVLSSTSGIPYEHNVGEPILASAYVSSDPNDPHASTDWQCYTNPNFMGDSSVLPVLESLNDSENKTSWTPTLDYEVTYYFRARYRSAGGIVGPWSDTLHVVTNPEGRWLTISPALNGKTRWNLDVDGPLGIYCQSNSYRDFTITTDKPISVLAKLWGAGSNRWPGCGGGFVRANVVLNGTYRIIAGECGSYGGDSINWGWTGRPGAGASNGSTVGGGYSGLFVTSTISQANAILIAGGASGSPGGNTDTSKLVTTSYFTAEQGFETQGEYGPIYTMSGGGGYRGGKSGYGGSNYINQTLTSNGVASPGGIAIPGDVVLLGSFDVHSAPNPPVLSTASDGHQRLSSITSGRGESGWGGNTGGTVVII